MRNNDICHFIENYRQALSKGGNGMNHNKMKTNIHLFILAWYKNMFWFQTVYLLLFGLYVYVVFAFFLRGQGMLAVCHFTVEMCLFIPYVYKMKFYRIIYIRNTVRQALNFIDGEPMRWMDSTITSLQYVCTVHPLKRIINVCLKLYWLRLPVPVVSLGGTVVQTFKSEE